MEYEYTTSGVCSRRIHFSIDGGIVTGVKFDGGCSGNTQGICALVTGMKAEDVIKHLKGIKCGYKPTSCPDQLARAIEKAMAAKKPET